MVLFMSGMVFDAMLEPPWGWGNKGGSLKCNSGPERPNGVPRNPF